MTKATRGRLPLWAVGLVPLVVAGVLVVRPSLDGLWQEQRVHFWVVSAAALGGVIAATAAGEAAGKRDDVRLFLLACSFAVAAAALGLHALATPTVLVGGPTSGFETIVPAGLAVSARSRPPRRSRSRTGSGRPSCGLAG